MILSALVQAGNECLVYGFGDGCGEILPKHKTLAVRGLQYVFYRQGWTDFRFLAGGTGVVRALVQMVGLRLGGRLRGAIAKNTKPLLCGYCNMFFVAKAGQILGF